MPWQRAASSELEKEDAHIARTTRALRRRIAKLRRKGEKAAAAFRAEDLATSTAMVAPLECAVGT